MSHDTWNPWHGCRKYSEGCDHCYMYYLDNQRGKSGEEIYRVKTNFNKPLKKDRQGHFHIKSGESLRVCMTSDFFLEEADAWRDDVWNIMRQRPDVHFWLLTKRAYRIRACLPWDWLDGWDHVSLNVTVETRNAPRNGCRFYSIYQLNTRASWWAPFLGKVDLSPYLATGQLETVLAEGENYDGQRPLYYEWVKALYDQCARYGCPFPFWVRATFLSKTEKRIKSAKRTNMCRLCGPGCNTLPIIGITPYKNEMRHLPLAKLL